MADSYELTACIRFSKNKRKLRGVEVITTRGQKRYVKLRGLTTSSRRKDIASGQPGCVGRVGQCDLRNFVTCAFWAQDGSSCARESLCCFSPDGMPKMVDF
jgi:hypothetical protein